MTRSRYIDVVDPENISGKIRAEACRWQVVGPFHTHEFRYIYEAETSDNFIIHKQIVEHWLDGKKIDAFEWGHGQIEAYESSRKWTQGGTACLVSCHIFRHDLPCCGGPFVSDKEIVDYFTLSLGHCGKCGQKWEITDGHHFTRSIKVVL